MKLFRLIYFTFFSTLIFLQACKYDKEAFALCGMGIAKPYYYTGLKYRGGLYQIKKSFKDIVIDSALAVTGIVKVRFKVNCRGEIGDLITETFDLNYKPAELNSAYVEQIITRVAALSDWVPGTDEKGGKVNSHSFLSFRIKENVILEILPK